VEDETPKLSVDCVNNYLETKDLFVGGGEQDGVNDVNNAVAGNDVSGADVGLVGRRAASDGDLALVNACAWM
jgi:hypothetical protein